MKESGRREKKVEREFKNGIKKVNGRGKDMKGK